MLHALRPRHFADMHQAFDALLQFDEGAVIGDADDPAAHMRSHRVTLRCIHPGIGRELFEAQRDTLFFAIKLQYLDLDLVAHLHQIARVRMPSSCNCSRVWVRFSPCSSSSNCLRDTTILPRFLFSLMMRTSMSWPFIPSRLRTGRKSTCEPGRNARAPRMSTVSPPLMRSMTRPFTAALSLKAFSISSQARRRCAFSCERLM